MIILLKLSGEELLRARTESRKAELNEQLKDVINEWRKNRAKEEEELQRVSNIAVLFIAFIIDVKLV